VNEIDRKLQEREQEGRPVKVCLIGAGVMGTEILATTGEMAGMDVSVVVDLTLERAVQGFIHSRKGGEVVATTAPKEAQRALDEGKRVATTDYRLAISLRQVEAVVDATGSAEMGATVAMECFDHRKHLVMMNVECDVTIGPVLRRMAENAGVVYSLASGDEPAAILELYRFARAIGMEVVAVGKGKNNPLDLHATPEDLEAQARVRRISSTMLCEFVDGSKTAVEMAAVSNATGLVPDVRGMHGAQATVSELTRVFVPQSDGGVLSRGGVVDFAIGVHPGVFLVFTTTNARLREALVQRDMGNGPYYLIFRPYHLCSMEVPLTVAQAVFYGESCGHPGPRLVSECIAVAKRSLRPGETLDGIGGYCYRGSIDLAETVGREHLLPLGLAKGCIVKKTIRPDTPVSIDDVEFGADSVLLELRRIQDRLYA
jgi:predicted homoserine dehydrogenase-like protein